MVYGKVFRQNSIDGINYRNKDFVRYHMEFTANPRVKSFKLPQVNDGQRRGKFGSLKCEINGITFDSVMEGRYYVHLLDEKAAGRIKGFERQTTFNLIPAMTDKHTGKKYLKTDYRADFVITENDDSKVVIDVKGQKTEVFRLKEKIFRFRYPEIDFRCVQWDDSMKEWRNLIDIEKDKRKRKLARTKKAKEKKAKKTKK